MMIADFEGVPKIQLDPITFKIERVIDRDFAKIYRVWLKEGFPLIVSGNELIEGNDSSDDILKTNIQKSTKNRFNNFLMSLSLRLIA